MPHDAAKLPIAPLEHRLQSVIKRDRLVDTGAMLARMNFAATLAANQRFNLAAAAKPNARSPESLLSYYRSELVTRRSDANVVSELLTYLKATGAWTGNDAQVQAKAAGLVHLIAGSPEYQFV